MKRCIFGLLAVLAFSVWGTAALSNEARADAFEDILKYVEDHYHVVEGLTDKDGKPSATEGGKPPYEAFFAEALAKVRQRRGE